MAESSALRFFCEFDRLKSDLDRLLKANPGAFLGRAKILHVTFTTDSRKYSYYANWREEHIQAVLAYLRLATPNARRAVAEERKAEAKEKAKREKAELERQKAQAAEKLRVDCERKNTRNVEETKAPTPVILTYPSSQPSLFDEEELTYHNVDLPGFFAILQRKASGTMRQTSHKLADLPKVIPLLDKTLDSWISQAEFTKPNRRVVNLWRVGLLFVDLDTYAISIDDFDGTRAQINAEREAYRLTRFCADQGIPAPSIVVFSGRGLQAKWLLNRPLPRAALPRWNAAQKALVQVLAPFGADRLARDASRVLRIAGTVNTKNNEYARVVHVETSNGEIVHYDFDLLCEWLLPVTREQVHQKREERRVEREAKRLTVVEGGRSERVLKGFSGQQLAWHRVEDLRLLMQMRGGVPEGKRMQHLFWLLNFLVLSGITNSTQMFHEAAALAKEIDPSWGYESDALSTLFEKAKAYNAGEKVELNGKKYPPLYTPKNDTLINLFGITSDEQKKLKTIVSKDIARERDAERKKAQRIASGATPREQSRTQQRPWESHGMSRATWYRHGCPSASEQAQKTKKTA